MASSDSESDTLQSLWLWLEQDEAMEEECAGIHLCEEPSEEPSKGNTGSPVPSLTQLRHLAMEAGGLHRVFDAQGHVVSITRYDSFPLLCVHTYLDEMEGSLAKMRGWPGFQALLVDARRQPPRAVDIARFLVYVTLSHLHIQHGIDKATINRLWIDANRMLDGLDGIDRTLDAVQGAVDASRPGRPGGGINFAVV